LIQSNADGSAISITSVKNLLFQTHHDPISMQATDITTPQNQQFMGY